MIPSDVGTTHHVNPCPGIGIISAITTSQPHQENGPDDRYHTAPEYAQDCLAGTLGFADLKPPDSGEELAVTDYTHHRAVRSEQEVIEAHGRLWCFRVSVRILRAYRGRVEEGRSGDGVHAEAKDVECRKVYGETERGFARVVRDGLGVETT